MRQTVTIDYSRESIVIYEDERNHINYSTILETFSWKVVRNYLYRSLLG